MSAPIFPSTYDLLKGQYPDFITLPQAAEIVGNSSSIWYKWLQDDTMPVPSVMIGTCRRIRLADLCEHIDVQIQGQQKKQQASSPKRAKTRGRPPRFNGASIGITHAPA